MVNDNLVASVVLELQKSDVELTLQSDTFEQLLKQLSEKINYLITKDFFRLIAILYRLDISEKKLKALLSQSKTTNAGDIIAGMIIERQLQKIKSRQAFKSFNDIPEEDKW